MGLMLHLSEFLTAFIVYTFVSLSRKLVWVRRATFRRVYLTVELKEEIVN